MCSSDLLKRFTTYEKVEDIVIIVVKKDKSRQRFDKSKILNGVVRACEKRPVPLSVIEQMVDEIETGLNNMMKKEVDSSFIGELVMDKLKDIDEVAYVRFASVYRQFTDINTFISEIETLLEKRKNSERRNSGEK